MTLRDGAISDTSLTSRGIRPDRKTVAAIRLKAGLVVPKMGVLKIINAFRGHPGVVNSPLPQGLPDGLPPSGEPAGDVFLKNQKRRQDHHDQSDVFDEGLSRFFSPS